MNAPDRYELFLLPDGVPKLKISPDNRIPNAITVLIEKEEHTLGNLLTTQLVLDPRVIFAGYKVAHPLFAQVELRIQTEDGYDPRDALKNACLTVIRQLEQLRVQFVREAELKKLTDDFDEDM
ncbi:hypothetical protein CANCADRAFT_2640 [Tortispora caseinolytica NRRL Y-17796]|uniref:DNA-directed RNA polymerase RBP11-like dimerisation domain-containing protein n=1 Tax=Tortispora caseinolytica NRRL Y-17796 TaxID=767744 RepID=A0A1E4TGM3_9ASCO|nr:hypothetical protein CANCADRAFT_2640 [Tortispora caseinolytica NRRL Y-17796]